MAKVSIIVPVFNSAKYLPLLIDSLKNQSLKEIQLIFVDDGSSDDSFFILKNWSKTDSRVLVLKQDHQRAGAARNLGMRYAIGEFLLFLDSDDFFEYNMAETLYEKAVQDDSDIVICNWRRYDDILKQDTSVSTTRKKFVDQSPFSPISLKKELFTITNAAPWNKLFKRSFVQRNKIRFENLKSANDFTFVYTCLAMASRISICEDYLIHYRINQKDNISATRNKQKINIIHAAIRLYENLYGAGVFNEFSKTFYTRVNTSIDYELESSSFLSKMKFYVSATQLLPSSIRNEIIIRRIKREVIGLFKMR